jgi:hypothetical protein
VCVGELYFVECTVGFLCSVCLSSRKFWTCFILVNKHSIVPNEEIMNVVHITNKGSHINTMEKFCMYTDAKLDIRKNNGNYFTPNALFHGIIRKDVKSMMRRQTALFRQDNRTQ